MIDGGRAGCKRRAAACLGLVGRRQYHSSVWAAYRKEAMSRPAPARTLRILPADVLQRLAAGEPVRFLDARSEKAWKASDVKLPGAVRIRPLLLTVDAAWDRSHLTVVY